MSFHNYLKEVERSGTMYDYKEIWLQIEESLKDVNNLAQKHIMKDIKDVPKKDNDFYSKELLENINNMKKLLGNIK